jgi:F-type H+-transporting ATPase subunit epsilon
MANFPFELVSPEKLVFSGEVEQVVVPGAEGEFGVLAGHAPFVSTLKAGILTIFAGGQAKRLVVRGGFAEASPAGLTVLAELAVPVEEMDAARLAAAIKNAEEDVADAKSDAARAKAEAKLAQLGELKAVLNHAGGAH